GFKKQQVTGDRGSRQPCEWCQAKIAVTLEPESSRLNFRFFLFGLRGWHLNSPPRPGEASHPAPSARKSATRTAQKTALCAPCEHPGGSGIRNWARNWGPSPPRGSGRCELPVQIRYTTPGGSSERLW